MLLIDPRAGSDNYIAPLRALGAPVEIVQLDYADVAFPDAHGRGIGLELKKLHDLLSCITTKRFSGHQLPGLVQSYAEVYLIVEGIWRPNPSDGVLEVWRGGWVPAGHGKRKTMYRDLDAYLTTMEVKGGVRLRRTTSEEETARVVYGLYRWYEAIDEHKSHLATKSLTRDGALFIKPTFARRVAADIDGIGYDKAGAIATAFPTVRQMMNAGVKDWAKVSGVGKKLAERIVAVWDSEE